jgi:L-fuconolactonase
MICDSQVHAPNTPRLGPIPGMEPAELLRQMDAAGVARCVIVPMVPPGPDPSANNAAAVEMAQANADRFAVMAPFDLTRRDKASLLTSWRSTPCLLGVRVAFLRAPNLSLLTEHGLDWFWSTAEESAVPVMLLAPDLHQYIGEVAARHPRLRLLVDHFNLHPAENYEDLEVAVRPLLALERFPNVAIKASALPCWATDQFPYRSVHRAIRAVVETFGARRVFWGSDLTRLPCSYSESIRLFTDELRFLGREERDWIMGRGVMEWLGWKAAD